MNFITTLWQRLLAISAPAPTLDFAAVAPAVPMRQEQFPDIAGAKTASQREDAKLTALYQRLVHVNNAHVYRDYGKGRVVEHHDATVPSLSRAERRQLRAHVKIIAPKTKP